MASPEEEHSPESPNNSSKLPRRWESIVEQQIAEARERGEFDNLRGHGQPLRLEENPLAKGKALAYSLLKNNHMVPPEIERAQEIAQALKQAEALLARLRYQRVWLRARATVFASERRSYGLLLSSTEQRYREALTEINRKILSLNISTPPAFHQRMIDIDGKLQAFHSEFALES